MLRLALITAALAAALVSLAHGQGAPATAEPARERGLAFELGPELPRPEVEARADPRFAAAYRYTTARQAIAVGASAAVVACLFALYFTGLGGRLARLGGGKPIPTALITAAAVGVVVAVVLGAASALRVASLRAAGGYGSFGAALGRPLCYGLGAAAFVFTVGATRKRWPRTWWIAATIACVVVALAWVFLLPLPRAAEPASPTAGLLQERARYLSSHYEIPAYKIAPERRRAAPGTIAAVASLPRRTLIVSPGAETLDRYEAEVLLATAILRAETMQKSLFIPAALLTFLALLPIADALSQAVARRRKRRAARADAILFAAFLWAALAVALPFFNTWSRHLCLKADGEAVRVTRKPITAVSLYYRAAAANLVAAEPNAVLHFLVDAVPSAAERSARARRLRVELAARP
jgi:hypothetical protein